MSDVTRLLSMIEAGDQQASNQLLPLVYDELRKLAAARMARERPDHTLQPTALVHEAYLRLMGGDESQHWNSRGHFFGAAAEAMRRILVENARQKQSARRGGGYDRCDLSEIEVHELVPSADLLTLDEAITNLEKELMRPMSLSCGISADLQSPKPQKH